MSILDNTLNSSVIPNLIATATPMDAAYHPSSNTGDMPVDSPADGTVNTGIMPGPQLGSSPLSATTARVRR